MNSPVAHRLFADVSSAVATVVVGAAVLWALAQIVSWAVIHATWSEGPDGCTGAGACWSFLREKHRFILFGIYPPPEQWRPLVVCIAILGLALWTLPRAHWTRATAIAWVGCIAVSLLLMSGGLLGLAHVPTSAWGGVPITLLLTVLSLTLGFPFAVLLALGRRSELPAIRLLCIGFIEIVRALPLVSLLFMAAIFVPLLLPESITIDNLFRALLALTCSSAAYLAEVVRGGLQGVESGQSQAAHALGLTRIQTLRLIVLPQALRKVIPALTNTVVVTVKNTSLVLVVGLFDLLSAGRAALVDPNWPAPYAEVYTLIALIYFVLCFGIARYSQFLERTMSREAGV